MPNELKYHVFGYDKDGDAYELLFASRSINRACELASDIILSKQVVRRFDNGEPFDWLVVARSDDPHDLHKIFSDAYPDGYQPV